MKNLNQDLVYFTYLIPSNAEYIDIHSYYLSFKIVSYTCPISLSILIFEFSFLFYQNDFSKFVIFIVGLIIRIECR